MSFLLALLAVTAVLRPTEAAACALLCDAGKTCFADSAQAMDCLKSIPFNEEWANATIDVLSQSLENFGFGPLYHNTGPPYSIKLDVQQELSNTQSLINAKQFPTDLDFQEHVQGILTATLDAHTRYSKPACYNTVFLQPFAFDMRVEATAVLSPSNEPVVYLMPNLYTDQYSAVYPDADVAAVVGKQVVLLNGVELVTEVASWGDDHETRSNNPGVRFNAAIRSYLYRSAMSCNIAGLADLTVTLADGTEHTFPWLASYTTGLADTAVCAAVAAAEASEETMAPSFSHDQQSHREAIESPQPLVHEALHESRPDRQVIVPTTTAFPVSCFVQTVVASTASQAAGVSKVLVMKVSSFSGDGFYLDFWDGFLSNAKQCLSAEFDLVVVDVMQNGGGYVCLGIRLIELLVEEFDQDHTKVQMHYDLPHSALMDKYIEVVNAPDPYPNPQDVEQILDRATQQAFPDGRAYYYPGRNVTQGGVASWRTNFFSLNCTQAEAMPIDGWRPPRYMSADKLVIMTDGTCGSTCASFTKIPQEAGKATFVGVGGLWDQGMDVSSFAGGFVCSPSYLQNIAALSGVAFPKFLTNQRWQFGWAAWYSAKLPSRPVQFTVQTPDERVAFWGFPHASINATVTSAMVSSLYDRVIASSVTRLAASAPTDGGDGGGDGDGDDSGDLLIAVIALAAALAVALAVLVYVYLFGPKTRRYSFVERDDPSHPLQKDLVSSA